eukprot:10547782-Alexandrium_andersonii.AAC.1
MSASLVGSEMCIRDRGTCIADFEPRRGPFCPFGEPGTAAADSSQRAPVSYTHLTLPTICSV